MIKVSTQQEAITLINSYAPSTGAPKYTTQVSTDVKGEIDNNTVTVDFNTTLTSMDRSSRKKKNQQGNRSGKGHTRPDGFN